MKPVLFFTVFALLPAGLWAQWDACAIGGGSQTSIDRRGANGFAVTAVGNPLGGPADTIAFVSGSAKLEGDCEIITRVTRLQDATWEWAEGGLMLRETLGTDSKFVALACTQSHGLHSYARTQPAAALTNQEDGAYKLPYWIKLVRQGNHVLGYKSSDGMIWIQTDDVTVPMRKFLWVGAFATSGPGPAVTVVFDHIVIHMAADASAK